MKLTLRFAAVLVCISFSSAYAATLAGWNSFDTSAATNPLNTPHFPVQPDYFFNPGIDGSNTQMEAPVGGLGTLGGFIDNGQPVFGFFQWETGSIVNMSQYFEVAVNVSSGFLVDFSSLQMNIRMDETNLNLHVRSSQDGFNSDLAVFNLTNTYSSYTADLSTLSDVTSSVSFRFYGTDAITGLVFLLGLNSPSIPGGGFLALSGNITPVPESHPLMFLALGGLMFFGWSVGKRMCRSLHLQGVNIESGIPKTI